MYRKPTLVAVVAALCLLLTLGVPVQAGVASAEARGASAPLGAPPADDGPGADSADPGSIIAILGFAAKLGSLIIDCQKNYSKYNSCWEPGGGTDLSAVTASIDRLSKQIEANQRALQEAMNTIFAEQKYAQMLDRYTRVSRELAWAEVAMQKLNEFTACLALFTDPSYAPGAPRTCTLTDINGDNPSAYAMTTPDDLYREADGPPTDDMSDGGPVARLFFATLYQFGGKAGFALSNLNERATALQESIAGTTAMRLKDGLLEATVDWMNARLITTQGGTTGAMPTFVPGTYVVEMNNWAEYYVNREASFFAPVVAALTVRAAMPGLTEQQSRRHKDMAATLENLARKGRTAQPQWALDKQLDGYTVNLQWFAINPNDPAVPAPAVSFNPQRVGFVIGTDGSILRLQHDYGATWTASEPAPGAVMPTYGQLALIRASIDRSGARWGNLRAAYPLTIPSGSNAAWWAEFGTSYRKVELRDYGSDPTFYMYQVSDQLPGSWVFGQNVTYLTYHEPCAVPVRMTDTPQTVRESWLLDGGDTQRLWRENFVTQTFRVRSQENGDRYFDVKVNVGDVYNAVVRTAAVPAFQLWARTTGTGVFFNCSGQRYNHATNPPANWVWVRTYKPEGLFTKLSTGPVKFSSCSALRDSVWRGIGRPTARDRNRPAVLQTASQRQMTHRKHAAWYKINKHLDRDRDGIACEPGQ